MFRSDLREQVFQLTLLVGKQMAQIDDLNAALTKLQGDVTALAAAVGTPVTVPTDLTAQIAQVGVIDAAVLAATPASAPVVQTVPPAASTGNPTLPS